MGNLLVAVKAVRAAAGQRHLAKHPELGLLVVGRQDPDLPVGQGMEGSTLEDL